MNYYVFDRRDGHCLSGALERPAALAFALDRANMLDRAFEVITTNDEGQPITVALIHPDPHTKG